MVYCFSLGYEGRLQKLFNAVFPKLFGPRTPIYESFLTDPNLMSHRFFAQPTRKDSKTNNENQKRNKPKNE